MAGETTLIPLYQPNSSEATIARAAKPLPPLAVAGTIKVPTSVKTVASGSAVPPARFPTEATIIQAGTIPLPASSIHVHTSYTAPIQPTPSQVSLPPSIKPHTDLPCLASPLPNPGPLPGPAPTHRQQMPLPRPALTPRPSNDALGVNLGYVKDKRGEGSLMARFESAASPDNSVVSLCFICSSLFSERWYTNRSITESVGDTKCG